MSTYHPTHACLPFLQGVIAQHFFARVLCLIIWPVVIYMTIFAFHLMVLSNSGNGDGFFSSEFQSTLVGNELYDHRVPECMSGGVGFDVLIVFMYK